MAKVRLGCTHISSAGRQRGGQRLTGRTVTVRSSSTLAHGRSRSKALTCSAVTAEPAAGASSRGAVVRITPSAGRRERVGDAEFGSAFSSVGFPPAYPNRCGGRALSLAGPPHHLRQSGSVTPAQPSNATSTHFLPRLQPRFSG